MKKTIALLTALVLLAVLCVPAGAANVQPEGLRFAVNEVPAEVPASAQEWEVLRIANAERMNEGLQPLTMFAEMQTATDIRALEIVESFSHTRPDGTDCFTVLDEVGVSYSTAGENIAAGYQNPASVMDSWMNSPGHRANILNAGFKHIGVGYTYSQGSYYGAYWVQLFCTGWGCSYSSFEILGEPDMSTPVDELGLAGRFTCGEGNCYMPLTSSMCVSDTTASGVRTVTFSCFGLTASVSFGGGSPMLGDIDSNGTVDSIDALLALRHAMGLIQLNETQIATADINGNGICDSTDALQILRFALGLINEL